MNLIPLFLAIIMLVLFIKDGFIVPVRLKKQGKLPPSRQLALVLVEIAFLSFFLVLFARIK